MILINYRGFLFVCLSFNIKELKIIQKFNFVKKLVFFILIIKAYPTKLFLYYYRTGSKEFIYRYL